MITIRFHNEAEGEALQEQTVRDGKLVSATNKLWTPSGVSLIKNKYQRLFSRPYREMKAAGRLKDSKLSQNLNKLAKEMSPKPHS